MRRPQPALVVALVALVAATGGTATALPESGQRRSQRCEEERDRLHHSIGAPGEPQFSDGGEGDCVWKLAVDNIPGTSPAGFAKHALGRVWLRGVLSATAGPDGGGVCNPGDPGESEDGLVFVLPPSYRPAFFDISGLAHAIVIAPDAGAKLNDNPIAPGGVNSVLAGVAVLDGVSIRAATGTGQTAQARANVSLQALRALAD